MISQEQQFKDQFSALIATFQAAFPSIPPPDTQWFYLWRAKYPVWAIEAAIQTLAAHPRKAQFTTDSVGKALSSRSRSEALKRAIAGGRPKSGDRPSECVCVNIGPKNTRPQSGPGSGHPHPSHWNDTPKNGGVR